MRRGDLVILEEQDRSRWNHEQIAEALPLVEEALSRRAAARLRCRRRSRPCIVRRPAPKIPTGRRSSASTTCSSACSRRPSCR